MKIKLGLKVLTKNKFKPQPMQSMLTSKQMYMALNFNVILYCHFSVR